ncbi:hypothetical protein MKW92_025442 [Papaver armeniacum]|nr:hypothetical protein MKW92_025442 [Papaver armeniacum]
MDDNWVDDYFEGLSLRISHDGSPKQLIYPRSEIKEPSIDLESSLKMFFQEAACDADDWTDVNTKYGDRRSFDSFLDLLETSGLEKYASNEDNDIKNISYQPNRWLSLEALPDTMVANECYGGGLSLIKLLQRIHSESGDDFKREQARLLESFLDQLINIQQEQRVVAYNFSEHLEQLRKSDAVAFSSNAVDGDGDRHNCPLIRSEHTMDSYMWKQSLCAMSRESAWLLKQLKVPLFLVPHLSRVNKILDIILVFISKFKKSRYESLDQYLLDECCRYNDHLTQFVKQNDEILDDFGRCIKNLQEQGVDGNSVAEMLLACFCRLFCSYRRSSPLGCIALWRILFESSLVNLRMDLICKNHSETVKLGVKQLDTAANDQLDEIRQSIDKLLTVGESVLCEFVAMNKTVAQVTYMLGDAFTTGGAGMKGPSDVTRFGTSSNQVDQVKDFDLDDFPWDKHVVHQYFKIDVDDPKTRKWMEDNPNYGEYV